MSSLIGQSLGRYHILEQLGEGGMAIVYKAYDTRLEREVAIKIIRTEKLTLETMEKTLKRFEREAKALAKLTHPNIVAITDYGEHEVKPYLVMPYLPGGTLKQRLGKPIPWEEAVRLLLPIGRALHYAHQQGIIHRDVKPSNILITQSGEPMLTDFGIAKILLDTEETADLTGTGMGVGTPEYMSPEQFQGKGVDGRTDVYSLGVVFYEMVTGRKPYQADTPAAIIIKQATDPLPRPQQWVGSLPDAVEKVLIKAMARPANERYQSMGEMVASLERLSREGTGDMAVHPINVENRTRLSFPIVSSRYARAVWIGLGVVLIGALVWTSSALGLLSGSRVVETLPTNVTASIQLTPSNFVKQTATETLSPTAVPAELALLPFDYTVRAGDTCGTIAFQFGVSVQSIVALNNLPSACIISENQVLKIPYPTPTVFAATPELVNINTASLAELDTLPGIGPTTAQTIIDYREQNGPFISTEDIMNVSGIGTNTYERIKDLITVGLTIMPSFTPFVPTNDPNCLDEVQFVADVTVPDGTEFQAGLSFLKTWRVKNTGTCNWTSDYTLTFSSGNKMGGPDSVPMPATVTPGQSVDISLTLIAPNSAGTYEGFWMLKSPKGLSLSTLLYLQIKVK